MALLYSSVAQVCRAFAQQLSAGINGPDTTAVRVLIGTPADATSGESDSDHRLNLFFFRFETSGFDAGTLPGDPWLLRLHCLVTPFCVLESPTSAGEGDLRLMGEVLRHLHEHPVSELAVDGGAFLVQAVFLNLGLDQINQLWSTQGDTVYRPSVLLELSLAPVLPRHPTVAGPRVSGLGLEVRATRPRPGDGRLATMTVQPPFGRLRPDTDAEDWAPALAIVDAADQSVLRAVSLALGSQALTDFAPRAWVAGRAGSAVSLRWSRWDRTRGWRDEPGTQDLTLDQVAIDPEHPPDADTLPELTLPTRTQAGQLMLVAERQWVRAADQARLTVRSDPVLVTLYAAGPDRKSVV